MMRASLAPDDSGKKTAPQVQARSGQLLTRHTFTVKRKGREISLWIGGDLILRMDPELAMDHARHFQHRAMFAGKRDLLVTFSIDDTSWEVAPDVAQFIGDQLEIEAKEATDGNMGPKFRVNAILTDANDDYRKGYK